jgi:hypothetical protein
MAHQLNSITVSGSLLSNEFLLTGAQPGGKFPAFDPSTFHPELKSDADFEAALTKAWETLKDRFDEIHSDLPYMDLSSVRNQWLLPLLRTLGFSPVYQKAHVKLPNVKDTFPISHHGWEGEDAPAIHLLSPQDDLDRKPAGHGVKSPQAMLQAYLNQDLGQRWAILSNGAVLRLLRDYYHTSQPGYVQFDLLQLFLTRDYGEFRSLYRLAHASRFAQRGTVLESETDEIDEEGEQPKAAALEKKLPIWLEEYYGKSRSEGSRAEVSLRRNVKAALEILGNGLLTPELRERLENPHDLDEYYRQLLRVIYRAIFLLFAEQRGLTPDDAPYAELYRGEYSLTALRNESEAQRLARDDGHDLWERVLLTFELAHAGSDELGVPSFNGKLFDPDNIDLIYGERHLGERNRRQDLPRLSNEATLQFIDHLGFTDVQGVKERINYRDLKVEEIGHIYESLLDYAPRLAASDDEIGGHAVTKGTFFLDDRGMSRKTSGSYYTPRELVQEIVSRALLPVIDERLREAGDDPATQEMALLSIKILDPASGSGAFLIAANDALAQRLADLRWQATRSAETYDEEIQNAKRDVLSHCIYGVDLNDMAVELAKVSLWINAASRGKPLNFLDHRIKQGNSLVGAPLDFYQLGIHPDAYKGRGDEDKDTLSRVRKVASAKQIESWRDNPPPLHDLTISLPNLDDIAEDSVAGVRSKQEGYEALQEHDELKKWRLVADYWTSAFFYPVKPNAGIIPNHRDLTTIVSALENRDLAQLKQLSPLNPQVTGHIEALRRQYSFFHYWLEFPEVFFNEDGSLKESPGFDVIIGNPPWERVKLQEQEFFATRDEDVAKAPNAAKRKALIKELEKENPALYAEFQRALVQTDATSNFLRVSGRYPLGGTGDVNTYQVFTENARDLTSARGRTGIIVPSGIATDNTTKDLFRDFVERRSLVSLDDFENREKLFQGVDGRMRFCLLSLTAPGSGPEAAEFSFFNTNIRHLNDLARKFFLTPEDFRRINPNTLTCPTFRTGRDAEITLKMYRQAGVFIDENDSKNGNPWGAYYMRLVDQGDHANFLRYFWEDAEDWDTPLYESKMVNAYNHRFSTFADVDKVSVEKGRPRILTTEERQEPQRRTQPRFLVKNSLVLELFNKYPNYRRRWLLVWRDISNATNERTSIAAVVPRVAASRTCPSLGITGNHCAQLVLSNLNSLVFDYTARQKVGGTHFNWTTLKQLPVLCPRDYTKGDTNTIVPRILELTYTAWDIKAFADDLWREADTEMRELFKRQWRANAEASGGGYPFEPPEWTKIEEDSCPLAPFTWNEERRAELRAELDALYAHLYGLTRDELLWILDPRDVDPTTPSVTFPGLRRNEEKKYGEYRTKRLVLKHYDALAERLGEPVKEMA